MTKTIDPKVGDTVLIETMKTNWNGAMVEPAKVTKVGVKYFYVATSTPTWATNHRFLRKCAEGSVCPDEGRKVVWSSKEAKAAVELLDAERAKIRNMFRDSWRDNISHKATVEDLQTAYRLLTGADR